MDARVSQDRVDTEEDLRSRYNKVSPLAEKKSLPRIDPHIRRFIGLSPFCCIATSRPDGGADNSPRGDAPGFVTILDDRTLLIPDRPGNNRLDTMSNIIANPNVGLIFFIPGVEETVRVNGRASITEDPDLLADMTVNGKTPKTAIRIDVEEAFLHCSKALRRAKLWHEDYKIDRKTLPTLGKMITDQVETGMTEEQAEARIQDSIKKTMY